MTEHIKSGREGYLFDNKALAALIIPLVIEQFLAVLVGMADSIMIASVGEAAVSGVSLVDQLMILLINIFAALATGGAVVAGQYLGQNRKKDACKSATQLVWFITISAIVITAAVYVGKYWILHGVFGKIENDVMGHANIYLLIVSASIPFMAMYNGGAAIFRAMGNSQMSMKISMIMNVINVCGNAFMIYGLRLGTEGVAIPTLISRMVAAVIIIFRLCDKKQTLHIERTWRYRFDWPEVKKILSIGIPNGLENSMFQLGKILVLSLVSTFGTYAIAANAVSNVVASFHVLPGMAMSLAITTVISRCVGAGDYEQVKHYTKKLLILTYMTILATVGMIYFILPQILGAYHLSAKTAETAYRILAFHGVGAIMIWPIAFNLPSVFRAAGDAKMCMLISILSMWIFRIGFSYLLGRYLRMGVFGVWVAMVIDWFFRCIFFVIRYFGGKWKQGAIV
ncbi:MAG: MATE family efflux transporter [Coprococcus sp.]|nr:MATE family efflux transporter [Coprococcus sp.]